MPFLFWDPTMVLIIPALILTFWAQSSVNSAFKKYSRVPTAGHLTGAAVAREVLNQAGLQDVAVERIGGQLSDHYDPRARVLRLSAGVHDSASIAAAGVAAHEAGHAIQHDVGYLPLGMRNAIWPVASVGSTGGFWLFLAGMFMHSTLLQNIGILLFFAAVVFYFVTLPVEFNASGRALDILEAGNYLTREEMPGARAVLRAAAWTYVAAATMAVSQLLRLLVLRNRRD
ncbi:MAG: zinc metallopeptidase [Symbiobacteriia bacterium]